MPSQGQEQQVAREDVPTMGSKGELQSRQGQEPLDLPMASIPHRCPKSQPTMLLALADELLEEIFLRLPTAADLARASMARVLFRRLITDHRFLRRFRIAHPPPLLGLIYPYRQLNRPQRLALAQPPHPSAAAAGTFAGSHADDFSCPFLPSPKRWHRRDLRDGRLLLSAVEDGSIFARRVSVWEFAVCNPLYRRYILLPSIPDDLAASAQAPERFMPFLAPPADEDKEGLSFRVIGLAPCATKLVMFIFSSASRQWSAVTFDNWTTLMMTGPDNPAPWWPRMLHYAHGCFCWAFYPEAKLIMLDTRTMEFSAINLPPGTKEMQVVILEAGEGRLGIFMNEYLTPVLSYLVLQNDGHGANQWQLEATFNLPLDKRNMLMGVAGGYLLIEGMPESTLSLPLAEREDSDVLSLNLKTLQIERFLASKYCNVDAHMFAGFPPSLSPPTI